MVDGKPLLVRFFEKRKSADDRETEGGGGGSLPKFVLAGNELTAHADEMRQELTEIRLVVESRLKSSNIPAVLTAKLKDDAIAKSHRGDMVSFLCERDDERVIGVSEDQSLLIRVDSLAQYDAVLRKLHDPASYPKAISGISSIHTFEPEVVPADSAPLRDEQRILKVKLIDYNNYQINQVVADEFRSFVASVEGTAICKQVKYSDRISVYEIAIDSSADWRELKAFPGLLSAEPMPTVDLGDSGFFSGDIPELPPPEEGIEYPLVGILDTGIASIPALQPWIIGSYSCFPEEYIDRSHGTFVAGLVCFGDLLNSTQQTGVSGCRLFDAVVFPDENRQKIFEDDLVLNIRDAVERHRDLVKVWNLSLGTHKESSLNAFSDFGKALLLLCRRQGPALMAT